MTTSRRQKNWFTVKYHNTKQQCIRIFHEHAPRITESSSAKIPFVTFIHIWIVWAVFLATTISHTFQTFYTLKNRCCVLAVCRLRSYRSRFIFETMNKSCSMHLSQTESQFTGLIIKWLHFRIFNWLRKKTRIWNAFANSRTTTN